MPHSRVAIVTSPHHNKIPLKVMEYDLGDGYNESNLKEATFKEFQNLIAGYDVLSGVVSFAFTVQKNTSYLQLNGSSRFIYASGRIQKEGGQFSKHLVKGVTTLDLTKANDVADPFYDRTLIIATHAFIMLVTLPLLGEINNNGDKVGLDSDDTIGSIPSSSHG